MEYHKKVVLGECEQKDNAFKIKGEIYDLDHLYRGEFKQNPKEFWDKAKIIGDMFKSMKLRKDDREELWSKFSVICEDEKRKQKNDYEKREFKSKMHRDEILNDVERTRPCSLFGLQPPNIAEMKALGNNLRAAGKLLSHYKEEMYGEHKQECFNAIKEMQKIHDAWWSELSGHRSRSRDEFQQRLRDNIEKNTEKLRKATYALERARNHANELRNQIDSAWSDSYKERACEWLSEEENRINSIGDSIRLIEEWIEKDREKLR